MKKFVAMGFSAMLVACGGGGGSPADSSSAEFGGVAATGAALGNAVVTITNHVNGSPCTETSVITSPLGSYTCTLKAGETAPFFIVVTDPTGTTAPLVSIATQTPSVGSPLIVNATPLTTAIVAQLNGGDALGVVSDKSKYIGNEQAFETIKANVLAQIAPILSSIHAPANYDPFTTHITAATETQAGDTADFVLDVIKITKTSSGTPAFSTISDSTPIELATATVPGDPASQGLPDAVSDLSKSAQIAAQALGACFAKPVSERVTLANGDISNVSNECQSIVTTADAPSGAPAFKHNGYSAVRMFYSLLTSDAMTGAKFSVPEIMAFYPSDASNRDRAVINIRFIDKLGNLDNLITVAQRFPNSSSASRPSNWWITGNQKDIDLRIRTTVVRAEDANPAQKSHFRIGLNIHINAVNSGNNPAPDGDKYDSALVTGPGLPTTGLWYFRQANSPEMVIATQRSSSPVTSFTEVCSSCSSFWMARTLGVKDAGALTYRPNSSSLNWSHTDDGSYTGSTGTRPYKGASYTFALYNNGILFKQETRTLLTDLVDATQAVHMQWNDIGPNTKAALDPTNSSLNGPLTSMLVDWVQNPSAEQVKYIWVSMADGGYDNYTPFAANATSVVATPAPGTTFTALTGTYLNGPTTHNGYREIGFPYRMLDGSEKRAIYTYYP